MEHNKDLEMSYYTTGLITHVLNNDACTVAVADLEGGSMGLMEPGCLRKTQTKTVYTTTHTNHSRTP